METESLKNNTTVNYTNLQFHFTPYINGGYAQYSGQYHKVNTEKAYRAKIEDQKYISESERKIFKGALHKQSGDAYVLTGMWTDGSVTGGPSPDRLGKLLAFDWWNQFRMSRNKLMGTLHGEYDGVRFPSSLGIIPGLVHRYFLQQNSPYEQNKYFFCISLELNLYLCQWRGVFVEIHDSPTGTRFSDPHEFKYISR